MGENKNTEEIEKNNMEKNVIEENQEDTEKEENSNKGMPIRTYLVMAIAGAYVAYLGFSLCSGVVKGEQGSSMGFLAAGIAFVVLGAAFVINGIRGYVHIKKEQKEQASQIEESVEKEEVPENIEESGKKMSIADRANLVKHMEETDEELSEKKEQEPEE